MLRPEPRLAGRLNRARIRLAHGVIMFSGAVHNALLDLALWTEPRFGSGTGPRPRPWAGLSVLVILLSGVALLTGGAGWAIVQALPPRGARP